MPAILTVVLLLRLAPEPDPDLWRWNLPDWSRKSLEALESQKSLVVSDRLNPYYLQGDFNGDGKRDLAVLAKNTQNAKAGILILLRGRPGVLVVGAGSAFGAHGDDFNWMDVWCVFSRGPVERGAGEGVPPRLRGDALLVAKSESASALIYWDGKQFRWYQQGD